MSSMKEHQYVCSGSDEEPHETEQEILVATIGSSPDAPKCPKCTREMKKVWTAPNVSYATHWHWAQRYQR